MAAEDEIAKTLLRIERLLGSSTVTTGLGRAPAAPRGAGTQRREDASDGSGTVKARKSFQATSAVLNTLNESTRTLNRSFTGLNRTVLNTRANFVEMNRSMRAYTRGAPTANVTGGQERVPEGQDATGINRTVVNAISAVFGRRGRGGPQLPGAEPASGGRGGGNAAGPLLDLIGGRGGRGGALTRGFGELASRVNFAGVAIVSIINQLSAAIGPVVRDVLMLESAGIHAASALGGLYIDAARSGMSLKEYTKVLQESSPAVTRALSMDDFNKTLQVSRDRLENLGIFGEEATKLSASLATSATVLGVPQAKLADATNTQIDTFAQLRKASLLTAEEFQNLTAQLANQQEVQSQLLGLTGPERAGRLAELTDMKTFGLSLGASKQASDAFGDALIKQRELTAPKRFEAAGRIRQSGAILGMDAGATEQLAQLSRKKNLSGDDKDVALRLGSELQSRIEAAMNSGNVNQENIAEQLQSSLDSSGIGNLLKTAGNVSLQTQSGPAGVNKDFATGTSNLIKVTGRLMSWIDGLEKNPVANAISGALGSAAFSLGLGATLGRILTRVRGGGAGAAGSAAGGVAEGAGGLGGRVSSIVGRGRDAVTGAFDILRRITDIGSIGPTLGETGQALQRGFSTLRATVAGVGPVVADAASGAVEFGRGLVGAAGRMSGAIESSFQILRGAGFSTLEASGQLIANLTSEVASTVGSAVSSVVSSGVEGGAAIASNTGTLTRALSGSVMGAVGGIINGAFKFVGGTGVISALIGGAIELFTGDLGSALNADDGSTWFGGGLKGLVSKTTGKIGDIIGAMIHGFATGITGLGDGIIAAWNWTIGSFFDGMKIELDHSLTNLFDRSWSSIMIMFKELELKVAKFFHLDTKGIEADIEVAKKSRDTLEKDGNATLTSIGDANQKLTAEQKAAADKTTANVATATKNVGIAAGVITSTQGLTQRILADSAGVRQQQVKSVADAAQATALVLPSADAQSDAAADIKARNERLLATPAEQKQVDRVTLTPPAPVAPEQPKITLATPGQTQRTSVTDPTLNKPADATPPVPPAPAPTTPGLQPQTPTDLLNAKFDAMILLLQQMLTAEQLQAAGLEGLARGLGRPTFADNEASFRQLNQS